MIRASLVLVALAAAAVPAASATKTTAIAHHGQAKGRGIDLARVNHAMVGQVRMSRVVVQPNGWGNNAVAARSDLDRVMRLYEREPGFRRDRYTKIVEIGRGKFQCDGRCSYLAPARDRAR